ncbi:MAG: phosphatase PAP2 family protein, partial [Syntrophomonadaceae bacterium]|nr:phosphatase PAP2 family protein [Syntrophomonadaceae bacterium]
MSVKTKFRFAGILGLLTLMLIILINIVDIQPIGPEGTSIGLSHINRSIFEFLGVNMLWYNITDWLGVIAIFVALIFAVMGLIQLIKGRSILLVDKNILLLGGLYLIVIVLYVFFEIAVVNYRPIIMPECEYPEASFPSSHIMIVCVIMGSTMMLLGRYINNSAVKFILQSLCAVIIGITVLGRLISGVHWFTDIVAGILISGAL